MGDIGRRIELEQNRLLTSYKNEYTTATGIEKALQSEVEEKKVLAMQLNVQANQYKVLQGEVEANTTIYQALLRRIKEIEANAATDLSSVEIVSLAELPVRPFMPNIPLFLLAGTVLGLMGGMGLAFLREHLDDTVRRTEEIERHSIPILGVIPLASKDEAKRLDSMIYHDPSSVFSEALRFTKLSVELSASVDHPAKSLLITSTASNDGKSTIAANLAQAFAASGERVLLMDADLQGPSLYHSFISNGKGNGNGGHNGIGLAGYLNGDNRFEEILQKTDVPNLHFISSGPVTRNQTQLLNSGKMKSLMNVLGNHFDRIIVDAPPFGSEVLFLGNMVHGVVLIANLGETNREALRVFLRNMQQVRGRLLGIVVNKLNMSRYYGDYYYKYFRNNYSTSKSKHKVRSGTFES
jgi:succinoglycan biosynthesis transport protein ExoP